VSLPGITADTGFLVGLERLKPRSRALLQASKEKRQRIVVPAAVLAEWWRGGPRHAQILKLGFNVEPMSERLAKAAGEALAEVPGATAIDAIVMASAASRGDVVHTSDFDDLSRLRGHFRAASIISV
jgi:PIN domain